jgi:hypothetical protein
VKTNIDPLADVFWRTVQRWFSSVRPPSIRVVLTKQWETESFVGRVKGFSTNASIIFSLENGEERALPFIDAEIRPASFERLSEACSFTVEWDSPERSGVHCTLTELLDFGEPS